jgi:hypothetical protein
MEYKGNKRLCAKLLEQLDHLLGAVEQYDKGRHSSALQKLPSISFIPENLFPSISARHDVADGTGKLNPRRS